VLLATYNIGKRILSHKRKAAHPMRKRRYPVRRRAGLALFGIGAAMIIAMMLPFWFWWISIGIGFLYGGISLLKK